MVNKNIHVRESILFEFYSFNFIFRSDSHSLSEYRVNVDGLMYEFNVSVVDVGPKPLSCVKKHWKRDKKIINSCLKHFYPGLNN